MLSTPQNLKLAGNAQKNLTDSDISPNNRTPGHCAGWARETIWETYTAKSKYSPPSGLDAKAQYRWFEARGLIVPIARGSVVGDILYKFGGRHGHVGIRIGGNRVAENSSVHGIGEEDARGIRTLNSFGQVDGIVRLP